MLDLYKANLVLTFSKMEDGEVKNSRVTLSNVRTSLTEAEIVQLTDAFSSLISHELINVDFVQFNNVVPD